MATKGWSLGALVAAFKAGAFADFGTTSGTIAQGNDTRIVHAVQDTNTALTMPGTINSASTITANDGNIIANAGVVIARDATRSSTHQPDGNISGPVWDSSYLSTHIGNRTNTGVIAAKGYFKDTKTGLMLQWASGVPQTGSAAQNVSFYTSFPNAILLAGVFTRTSGGAVNVAYDSMFQMVNWDVAKAVTFLQQFSSTGAGAYIPDVWAIGR